jgi:hypothetical protein
VLPSKIVPDNMRWAQARKQKHSGKRASDDYQSPQMPTRSATPTSSSITDGKENKQVSPLVGYISMTNIMHQRYQTRSITSIRFSQALLKASKQRRVIGFTNPIMAGGRF